jgi:hypothetical protein
MIKKLLAVAVLGISLLFPQIALAQPSFNLFGKDVKLKTLKLSCQYGEKGTFADRTQLNVKAVLYSKLNNNTRLVFVPCIATSYLGIKSTFMFRILDGICLTSVERYDSYKGESVTRYGITFRLDF